MSGNLGTAVLATAIDLTGLNKGIDQAEARSGGWLKTFDAKVGRALSQTGVGMSALITAPAIAAGAAVFGLGTQFESSFADVTKTVEGTDQQLADLRDGIRAMATDDVPATAASIAEVAAAAGALGIETPNILAFSRVMIDLGESTDLSATRAADALARWANISGMSQSEFSNLGSTVVALGNSTAATESEIVALALRLAGAGNQVGLTEAEVAAFAATLASVGIEAEAGGTALSRVMLDMQQAVMTGSDELETFAQVAGMSASEFKTAFEQDAAGAILSFISGLGDIQDSGGNTVAVLESLGLSEIRVRDMLLRTAGASDLLSKSLDTGRTAWAENTALADEAAKRYETTSAQLGLLRNQATDVAITLFDSLRPALLEIFGALSTGLDAAAQGADFFAGLPGPVQTAAVAFIALAATMGPLALGIGFVMAAASPLVLTLGGVALAVAGLAAAGVLMHGFWPEIVAEVPEAQTALDGVGKVFTWLRDTIAKIMPEIADIVLAAGDIIIGSLQAQFSLVSGIVRLGIATLTGDFGSIDDIVMETAEGVAAGYQRMGQGVVDGTQAVVAAGEKLLAPSTLLQDHIARGYVNLRDQSVAVDNVREVYDRAASAASQYLGVQVNANDIANGYIITQDGVAHSLERFTATAVQAQFAIGGQEDATSGLAQSLWDVEAGATAARGGLEQNNQQTQAATSLYDSLRGAIAAMGDPLGVLDVVMAGVAEGSLTAGEAISLMAQSGKVDVGDLTDALSDMRANLSEDLFQALLAGDAGAVTALNSQIAMIDGTIAEAAAQADSFAQSLSNLNTVQLALDGGVQTAANNMGEWQSDISETEKAMGLLDSQLASGRITQEEYNAAQEDLGWMLERTTGGLEDQNGAYIDAVRAKGDFIRLQDEIASQFPDLVQGSAEWEAAIREAGTAAGMSDGQLDSLLGGALTLEDGLADLSTVIRDLIAALTGIPAETDATVTVDTVVAEEAIGTVKEGFTEFDGGESQATLDVDNEPALTGTKDASEAAVTYAETEYMAQVEADPAVALREIASAQVEADDFRDGGPYIAALDADDQASVPIDDVSGRIHSLIAQNYTVHISADISAVYAAVAQANALLPHSPADEGPLARTPEWDWAFAGAPVSAERYVTQAADTAAAFLPVGGRPSQGPLDNAADWDFLFADLDPTSEDYGKRSADAFIRFFTGNLEDLANGRAMYDAQQALEESLMIREIAIQQGMGANVIAELDAQITAQQAAIAQIGEIVGSGIVDSLIEEIAQFDIGDALQLPSGGAAWSLDDIVSGDALEQQNAAIAEMQVLLRLAGETGDAELIAFYTEQLAALERQLQVLHDVLGTQTVQDLQDVAQAEEDARARAELLQDRLQAMGEDPVSAIDAVHQSVEDLKRALDLAILTPGTPMSVITDIADQLAAAQADAAALAAQAAIMWRAGLVDEGDLMAMGEAGGDAFIDAFNAAMGSDNAYQDVKTSSTPWPRFRSTPSPRSWRKCPMVAHP